MGPPGSWVSLEILRYAAPPRPQRQKNEIVAVSAGAVRASSEACAIVTGLDAEDQPLVSTLKADINALPDAGPRSEDADAEVAFEGVDGLQREVFDVTLVRGVRWSKNDVMRSSYSRSVPTTWT